MFIEMKTRKYTQKRRAEHQQQTRKQIVAAAMALHEELGPANTSIKAVAERAGVQRLTVYRHFADETRLFEACTTHWLELNPPPEVSLWESIDAPDTRTRAALSAFYRYYRHTEKMWRVSYRDVEEVDALKGPMAEFEAYLDQIRDELLAGWKPPRKARQKLSVTLRHCLRFSTWQSLKEQNMADKRIVDLVMEWIRGVEEN